MWKEVHVSVNQGMKRKKLSALKETFNVICEARRRTKKHTLLGAAITIP